MKEYLSKIKPLKLSKSDKYSLNLYKYLKEYPNSKIYMPIGKESYHGALDKKLIVGEKQSDGIIGNQLSSIFVKHSKTQYYFLECTWGNYVDITEQFMSEYIRLGRCLFDNNHSGWLLGDEERFTYETDDIRVCNWCGVVQNKQVKEVVKYKETWADVTQVTEY